MRIVSKASLAGVVSAALLGLGVAMTATPAHAVLMPHGVSGMHIPHGAGGMSPGGNFRGGNSGHGQFGRGFVGGFAAGAIIGTAVGPDYDYDYYGYDPCYRYRPLYDQWGRYLGRRLVDVCQ